MSGRTLRARAGHAAIANASASRHLDARIADLRAKGLTHVEALRFIDEEAEADEATTLRRVAGVQQLAPIRG